MIVHNRHPSPYNPDMKSATVSVIGRPSAGKSTLVNTITGMKVSITSPTPQTTRNKTRGIYTSWEACKQQVHGYAGALYKGFDTKEEAQKAQDAAKALFVGGGDMSNVPSTTLEAASLTDGSIGILDLMLKCGLVPSKKEARRLIEQGGVELDGQKVTDVNASVSAAQLSGDGVMIKKGKKVFHRASLQG